MRVVSHVFGIIFSCILIPFCLMYYMYYAFLPQYTKGVFSEDTFLGQYDWGVYRYRVIGRECLLLFNDFIEKFVGALKMFDAPFVSQLDSKAASTFYTAYFLMNTLFLSLSLVMVYLTVSHVLKRHTHVVITVFAMLFAVSQFVIVPYDAIVYFIVMVAVYLIFRVKLPAVYHAVLLAAVIILGAMTRETITLVLSFYAALIFVKYRNKKSVRSDLIKLVVMALTYVFTYLGLRLYYGFENSISSTNGLDLFRFNIGHFPSVLGFVMLAAAMFLISYIYHSKDQRIAMGVFLLAIIPYILPIVYTGIWMEIRLFVPVVYLGIMLMLTVEEYIKKEGEHELLAVNTKKTPLTNFKGVSRR